MPGKVFRLNSSKQLEGVEGGCLDGFEVVESIILGVLGERITTAIPLFARKICIRFRSLIWIRSTAMRTSRKLWLCPGQGERMTFGTVLFCVAKQVRGTCCVRLPVTSCLNAKYGRGYPFLRSCYCMKDDVCGSICGKLKTEHAKVRMGDSTCDSSEMVELEFGSCTFDQLSLSLVRSCSSSVSSSPSLVTRLPSTPFATRSAIESIYSLSRPTSVTTFLFLPHLG